MTIVPVVFVREFVLIGNARRVTVGSGNARQGDLVSARACALHDWRRNGHIVISRSILFVEALNEEQREFENRIARPVLERLPPPMTMARAPSQRLPSLLLEQSSLTPR